MDAQQVSTRRMVVVAWIVLLVHTQPLMQIRAPHVVQDTLRLKLKHPELAQSPVPYVLLRTSVHLSMELLDASSVLLANIA
jgi:hypothetical protein